MASGGAHIPGSCWGRWGVSRSPSPAVQALPLPWPCSSEAAAGCKARRAGSWVLGSVGALDPRPWPRSQSTDSSSPAKAQRTWGREDAGLEALLPGALGSHAGGMPKLLVTQRARGQGHIRTRRTMCRSKSLQEIWNRQIGKSGQSPSHHGNGTLAKPGVTPLFPRMVPLVCSSGQGAE